VHLNVYPGDDGLIFGPATRRIHGADRLREEVAGVSFFVSPTAFFQTNVAAAELMVRLGLDAIPPGLPVLDLFAGAGLFGLPLAQRGHQAPG
jgi:23S rRNA (uracil747-C5)-methyltransferase